MRILITGGAGFIGSNFVRFTLKNHPDDRVIVLDALTYAGNLENFPPSFFKNPNFQFFHGNICDEDLVSELMRNADTVVHFAAETHVDRSIREAGSFIETDIWGTYVLLESALKNNIKRFVHISTDEVYGEAGDKPSVEGDDLLPKSPYAASKAGADRLAWSYFATYGFPVAISRCSNNYGPCQYPEKLIPLFVTNALEDKPLPVYGHGRNTRDWIYVDDHCRAIDMLLRADGKIVNGEVFNISSECEKSVLDITSIILKVLGKPDSLIKHVDDRPGHVTRHAVNPSKIKKALGWEPQFGFEENIEATINWYRENESWWRNVKEKQAEYREWISRQYGE
ncbi:MAG TPA: dTDP-glucose 4,6-dehydratase [Firmicutes bacterium]|nr:dTDP-glucose 4,6-dehydratase [Bacillota bacterium]